MADTPLKLSEKNSLQNLLYEGFCHLVISWLIFISDEVELYKVSTLMASEINALTRANPRSPPPSLLQGASSREEDTEPRTHEEREK